MIVYVCIGNSDNKLSQFEWSKFVEQMRDLLSKVKKHGEWFSASDSRYQNACWCIEISKDGQGFLSLEETILNELRNVCKRYRQNNISWDEVPDPQFIGPV